MIKKTKEKKQSIKLRKKGFSYNEILKRVPVAKSTLSLWLRDVELAKKQKQRLTQKKLQAGLRGAMTRRHQRIEITKKIKKKAQKEIGEISKRDLWFIGIALYWGEGRKERSKGTLVQLGNSDPYLIKVFLLWLKKNLNVQKKDITFRIFLHENSENDLSKTQKYWSKVTGFPTNEFNKVSWKKNKIHTKRKNIGKKYFGLLRVIVKKSINLNREIQGWIEGINKSCGIV